MRSALCASHLRLGYVTTRSLRHSVRGTKRMRRLMELVQHGRFDLTPILTHTFSPDKIAEAYQLWRAARGCGQGRDQTVMGFLAG